MSNALSGKQMFVLLLLAFVAVFVFCLMLLNAVLHINVWHVLLSAKAMLPHVLFGDVQYGGG